MELPEVGVNAVRQSAVSFKTEGLTFEGVMAQPDEDVTIWLPDKPGKPGKMSIMDAATTSMNRTGPQGPILRTHSRRASTAARNSSPKYAEAHQMAPAAPRIRSHRNLRSRLER